MKVSEMKVADKIKVGKIGKDEPVIWLVGAHGHYRKGITVIIAENTLGNITFSPANPVDKNEDRRLYGNNRYYDSYVRKYLNDVFFKTVFSPFETAAITPVEIKAIKPAIDVSGNGEKIDVMADLVFLLSASEVGLDGENEEGRLIKLFKKTSRRRPRGVDGDADWWWLRTPDPSTPRGARYVNAVGALCSYDAYNGSRGLRPACNLASTHPVSGPDNDGYYTLTMEVSNG
jgi:hypothetical protein